MKDRSADGGGSPEAPRTEATATQGEEQGEPEAEMEEMGGGAWGHEGVVDLCFVFSLRLLSCLGVKVLFSLFFLFGCFAFWRAWGEGDVVRPSL